MDGAEGVFLEELMELEQAIGMALTKGRFFRSCPNTRPIGNHNNKPPSVNKNAPDFLNHCCWVRCEFQGMNEKRKICTFIWERKGRFFCQYHNVRCFSCPGKGSLFCRHEGNKAPGFFTIIP